ncbi:MAG: B12-binding domain-containing radical SAM protein [Pseudonocardia sp.]
MTPAPVTHRTAEENLGLGYLAAVLRGSRYQVRVVDGWLAGLTSEQIAAEVLDGGWPLLVGFACYRSNMARALEIAGLLRGAGFGGLLVAGGYGPTFHPAEFLAAGFDVVVRGEGEQTIVELAAYAATGSPLLTSVAGISWHDTDGRVVHNPARAPTVDLDELPLPARDTLALTLARRSLVHVQSSRGCQASCTFCSIVAFERLGGGPQWRQRSITGFVDELEALAAQGVRYVKVIDDSLVEPPRGPAWCAELAVEITGRGLTMGLRGQVRADRVDDDVLAPLAAAGFFSFACGIENFSPTALRRMAKRADVADNWRALAGFARHGLIVQAGHILFDHATTMAELEDNWAGMTAHPQIVSKGVFTEMYAAAGTPFTRTLDRRGLLQIDTTGLGNNHYPVADPAARTVYHALKGWQRSHSRIYDMTIDPLSAPKAIDAPDRAVFHELAIALRQSDLRFFRAVLDAVTDGGTAQELAEFTEERITATAGWYRNLAVRTDAAYTSAGLTYDAEDNPFIC